MAAAAEGARLGRPRSASGGLEPSPWGPAPLVARAPHQGRLAWPWPCCSVPPCCCRRPSAAPVSGGAWRAPPAGASWTGSTRWAAGCWRMAPRWGGGSRGLPAGPSRGVGGSAPAVPAPGRAVPVGAVPCGSGRLRAQMMPRSGSGLSAKAGGRQSSSISAAKGVLVLFVPRGWLRWKCWWKALSPAFHYLLPLAAAIRVAW